MDYVNDTGLPSVTKFFSPYIDKRFFKQVHLDRGNACHDVMAAHALCIPYYGDNFNPLWQPYIDSGKAWFDENVDKVLLVEQRLAIDGDFCGCPDMVCALRNGLTAVVDWKTSQAMAKYFRFQVAGYQVLVEHNYDIKIDVRIIVRLRKDFGYKPLANEFREHDYDIAIFQCCKAAYLELI